MSSPEAALQQALKAAGFDVDPEDVDSAVDVMKYLVGYEVRPIHPVTAEDEQDRAILTEAAERYEGINWRNTFKPIEQAAEAVDREATTGSVEDGHRAPMSPAQPSAAADSWDEYGCSGGVCDVTEGIAVECDKHYAARLAGAPSDGT